MPTPRAFTTLTAVLATLIAVPAGAATTDGVVRRPVVRHDAERLEVVVSAADTIHQRISLVEVLESDVMAFHFAVEAVDAAGAPVRLPAAFAIIVELDGNGARSRLRLTGIEREIILPRPLGMRVPRGAQLDLSLSPAGLAAGGTSVRLVISHERGVRAGSRIPVRSSDLGASHATADGAAWDWTAPAKGRLLAINGLPLERLDDVELVDATTGEVLWSTALRGSVTGATASPVLRMGVPVVAGRTYRLSARGATGSARDLVALVLPTEVMAASLESGR